MNSANVSASGAALTACFEGVRTSPAPNGAGFRYRKSSASTWSEILYTEGISSSSGTFSLRIDNLAPSTTYQYEAYMNVWNGKGYTELSRSGQFTTAQASAFTPTGWLELPAVTGTEDAVVTMYKGESTVSGAESDRNYTVNYSKQRYAALWTAYTLTEDDVTGGQASTGNWTYNNAIFGGNFQVGVSSSSYPSNYVDASAYTRGHQIPNADRTTSYTANAQTYYLSNQTPQLGERFNGSIWGALEKAGRGFVMTRTANTNYRSDFTKTDVLYVITGPCYGKAGTSESPVFLTASGNTKPEQLPVPKYYWKVFLKVKWNQDHTVISDACAIGFWYTHQEYAGSSFSASAYVKSVNQIEAWTGFDLFANLPDSIEESVEANADWNAFRTF